MNIETLILRNLVQDEEYMRTVIPHLKQTYFAGSYKIVFNEIISFNEYRDTNT